MAVVIGTQLRKELSGGLLFDDVSFKVERRERLALSGPNGAGKTTLLRMLAGETGYDAGKIVFDKGTRVALHDQRPPLDLGLSLREYALSGARDLIDLEEELRRLEAAMAAGDHGQETMARYSAAQARLEHAGGYAWRENSLSTLRGLGFEDAQLDRQLSTFSGGELTRASLARSLAGDPDLLLLDEPTNHLDVERLEWLERTLVGLDAAVILVAHDRWFLEAVTTAVLELEAGRSTYFPGQWHVWRREKAARALDASKSIERYNADIARLQRFVDRFRYKKSKAKQAQAKLTHIGRLKKEKAVASDELSLLTRRGKRLGFEFLNPPRSGKMVAEVDDLSLSAGDKHLLDDVTLAIDRGEHVALGRPERRREDHAAREAARRRRGHPARPRRRAGVLLAARGRARRAWHGARVRPGDDRAAPPRGPEPARAVPLLRLGDAREGGARALGRRAAAARAGGRRRVRGELPRPRRAHEPPRPRDRARRSRPRSRTSLPPSCWCRTTAPSSTRSPSERSRSRTARSGATTVAGRTTCGRVDATHSSV